MEIIFLVGDKNMRRRACRSVAKEKHTIWEDERQKRHLQIELERQSKRKQEKKIRI